MSRNPDISDPEWYEPPRTALLDVIDDPGPSLVDRGPPIAAMPAAADLFSDRKMAPGWFGLSVHEDDE